MSVSIKKDGDCVEVRVGEEDKVTSVKVGDEVVWKDGQTKKPPVVSDPMVCLLALFMGVLLGSLIHC